MKKEQLQKISTPEGAFEVLKPFIEQVSYVEVTPEATLGKLKMDSLDTLEVMNNVEKIYCEEPAETVFGEEWQELKSVCDLIEKMVAFAKEKLARVERIEIASEKVYGSIETLLKRFSKHEVCQSTSLKSLGIPPQRLKAWAESYFGFHFTPEEQAEKLRTVQDLYCLVIAHYDDMKR